MLLSPRAIDEVAQIVDAQDFYRGSHAKIYRAALALHQLGQPVDAITVADRLDELGQLTDVGGPERIHEIAALVPAAGNAAHYARIVVEMAQLRQLADVGEQIQRLAWERDGSAPQLLEQAREIVSGLEERTHTSRLDVETWHTFEAQAHDDVPTLIDGIWAEAAFGFIAAPPKKGKTWIAIAMAVSIATGRPFLGFRVPTPHPVIYVALEGHRAALRARIGAIARGLDVNPDGDELQNLHLIYKPAGINLAEPTWARDLANAAQRTHAKIIFVDVLRAAARIKENDQAEFSALRHNLEPITAAGVSIALLHHFIKLSDISRDRDPGERMSGSGAMYGALDAAIYITGSEDHARKLRLAFDTRDIVTPDHLSVHLQGQGTSETGGFTYRDAATFTVVTEDPVDEDDLKAPPAEIAAYVDNNGGDVQAKLIRGYFEISDHTLTRRLGRLAEIGIDYVSRPGKAGRLVRRPEQAAHNEYESLKLDLTPDIRSDDDFGGSDDFGGLPLNAAKSAPPPNTHDTHPVRTPESADLQEKPAPEVPTPLRGRAHARARTTPEFGNEHKPADSPDADLDALFGAPDESEGSASTEKKGAP